VVSTRGNVFIFLQAFCLMMSNRQILRYYITEVVIFDVSCSFLCNLPSFLYSSLESKISQFGPGQFVQCAPPPCPGADFHHKWMD